MPDLNFPTSPSLNQTYTAGNLRWNWNGTAWQLIPKAKFTYSDTAPSDPAVGDDWFDSSTGIRYVYVNDGDSSQWIEANAPSGVSSVGGASGAVSNAQLSAALTSAGFVSGGGGNADDAIIFTSLLSGI